MVARYASLFNARDWDGVRALLAETSSSRWSTASSASQSASLIELDPRGDSIARIRDFRHVPYIARDARFGPPE